MKEAIISALESALADLKANKTIPQDFNATIRCDEAKDKAHGDFASNIAMILAKPAGKNPRDIAAQIQSLIKIQKVPSLEKIEIAGPGFLNFFVSASTNFAVIETILAEENHYGRSKVGQGQKIQVEFVSANPTGPLHVGHGRGAAYGASIADMLEAAGYEVDREYYVNDAGRQMNILAVSVWIRYLQSHGSKVPFPVNGYQGDYVSEIAESLSKTHETQLTASDETILAKLPCDESHGGDKEIYIDAVIERARYLLGENYQTLFQAGLNAILADIEDDLGGFGIHYQTWFSEASVQSDIDGAIAELNAKGHIYEKEGALWFRSTDFGDDKDRVVKRDNGETTYFASDIAYHRNKYQRGYSKIINVWGADHHGYIARVKAALSALELDPDKLEIRLVQFAILYRGEERVQMSTRSGSFVTLRELREEVGSDACRFFYVTRKAEQHMDFDLELAKSQSSDNPVYYIQYAHARICSVLRKLDSSIDDGQIKIGLAYLAEHAEEAEIELAKTLARYPEQIERSALALEPHALTHYLRELSANFHAYYNSHRVLVDDIEQRCARVTMGLAVRQVLKNGLTLLGVSAPEEM